MEKGKEEEKTKKKKNQKKKKQQQAQQPFEMTQRKTKKEDDSARHITSSSWLHPLKTHVALVSLLSLHVESLTLYLSGITE